MVSFERRWEFLRGSERIGEALKGAERLGEVRVEIRVAKNRNVAESQESYRHIRLNLLPSHAVESFWDASTDKFGTYREPPSELGSEHECDGDRNC